MKSSIKIIAFILIFTFAFSTFTFAGTPVDIDNDAIIKDMSNFVEKMYYEPRDRVNNVIFYDGDYKLSSVKDYYVEYKNNMYPGVATVTYTGVGNYTGTFTTNFIIEKMPIANITTKASFNNKKKLVVSANNGSEDLVLGTDYNYSTYTDVDGNVEVKIVGIGNNYTGSCIKKIEAKDNPNPSARSYLKDVVITKHKNLKGKKIQLKWKKIKNIAGYQIKYAKKSSMSSAKKITLGNTYKTYTIKKLKKKKNYYIKMRCYIVYNNKKYYGSWTKAVKVLVKK